MYLKFYVKNQTLIRQNSPIVASGSKNYLFAEFRFSSEWSGVWKTAVFVSADGQERYHMIIEDGRCAVPWELIQDGGFYVSVFGGNRITSTQVFVDVSESGINSGITPPEPTEGVYEQILEKMSDIYDSVENGFLNCPDNYIAGAKLQNGAVTSEKIASGAVTSGKISDGAVTGEKLALNAVTSTQLADSAVTSGKIADGAVTSEKIAAGVIPSELPASDVYPWAKAASKPTYYYNELHNKPTIPNYTLATQEQEGLMSAADKIKVDSIGSGYDYDGEIIPLTDFITNSISQYLKSYNFTEQINTEFAIRNNLTPPTMIDGEYWGGDFELGNARGNEPANTENTIQWLRYNAGDLTDNPVWTFSQLLEIGKSYIIKITQYPIANIDCTDGIIEVVGEISDNSSLSSRIGGLETRMTALEAAVGAANAELEVLLDEGV